MNLRFSLSLLLVGLIAGSLSAANLEIGATAPDFKATGVDGKTYSLKRAENAEIVVVCFTCNQCPVAVAYEDRFIEFAQAYKDKGVAFVAINVNPESMQDMKDRAEEKGFTFPYTQDETGESARAYGARVTPHLFVLDKNRKLAYVGAYDDNINASKAGEHYVKDAVDALLAGKTPSKTKTRAVGCGIKPKRN